MSEDLDRQLREAFRIDHTRPDLDAKVAQFQQRVRSRKRMRAFGLGALVVVAGVGVALGIELIPRRHVAAPIASPPPSGHVVAWADDPAPQPSPTPSWAPGIAACQAGSLAANFLTTWDAAGNEANVFSIVNVAPQQCYVQGRPEIRLALQSGRTLVSTGTATFFPDDGPIRLVLLPKTAPPPVDGELQPGQAQLAFEWFDCNQADEIKSVSLHLATGTVVAKGDPQRFVRSDLAACANVSSSAPSLSVNNFETRRPGSETSSDFAILSARLTVPPMADAGERLRYIVTLSNTGQIAMVFNQQKCPVYAESIGAGGAQTSNRYRLNCAGLTIAPGESLDFEMYIRVPATGRGAATLLWVLDPDHAGGAPGTAKVQVS